MLAAGFACLLALLELTFLRFPTSRLSSGTGPKANVAIWFGPDGAGYVYLGLGLVYAALYIWVGAHSQQSHGPWRIGATWGLVAGAIWLAVCLIRDVLPVLGPLRPLSLSLILGSPVVAATLGAKAGEPMRDGILAGFWCGVVTTVLIAVTTVALDNAFATTLMHSSWMHDSRCPQPAGPALAGCAIGDDLGLVAIELTLLPLMWACLGAIGGAFGLAIAAGAASPQTLEHAEIATGGTIASHQSQLRAPIIFVGLLLTLFLAETILKLV